MELNWIDLLIIGIFALFGMRAYYKGFIKSIFQFTWFFLSMIASYLAFPYVVTFFNKFTTINEIIQNFIRDGFKLQNPVAFINLSEQVDYINGLKLPDFVTDALIANNNYEAYKYFKVEHLNDYITAYLSNVCVNAIIVFVTFISVCIGLRFIVNVLDLTAKLPILNGINRFLGLLFGLGTGLIFVWIVFIGLTFAYTNPAGSQIAQSIDQSFIAKYFYKHNLLFDFMLQLFPT